MARKRRKARRPAEETAPEVCRVCKKRMPRVSAEHLREHGMTMQRYSRMYGAPRPPSHHQAIAIGSPSDPSPALMSAVADRLLEDRTWVACLADEVGERMLTGPLRSRLTAMLTTMLHQRAVVHGQSLGILSGALAELQEDWRATQGGPGGGPTDTDVLLRMVEKAAKIVKDSEDAVQKTIRLALDEQRLNADHADSLGPSLYQGDGERLDMPAGMSAGDRETIRNLLSLVGKAANEAGTVDAQVVRGGTPGGGGAPGEGAQVPAQVGVANGGDVDGESMSNDGDVDVQSGEADVDIATSTQRRAPTRGRRRRRGGGPLLPGGGRSSSAGPKTTPEGTRGGEGGGSRGTGNL